VFEQADAEALPYPDDTFDAVISCVGVMFAPHHARAAAELVRVARPGGRLALLSWTPEGFIGQLLGAVKAFMPAPPVGAQPPPLWGREEHVEQLLAEHVTALTMQRHRLRVDRFATAVEFRDFFRDLYGPTVAVYRAVADDPARRAELEAALLALADAHLDGGAMSWEYLMVTADVA
jgi:SAM-dependent methyltransferase